MTQSILLEKSYKFALRIVRLSQFLNKERQEYVLSRKVLDSGTAIGMHVEEARQGLDRTDFGNRLGFGARDAYKTNFWLLLLRDTDYITSEQAESLISDCDELQKMLVASLKTTRSEG